MELFCVRSGYFIANHRRFGGNGADPAKRAAVAGDPFWSVLAPGDCAKAVLNRVGLLIVDRHVEVAG
ncbi:MAG: hypothetical protein ABIR77_03215, partial [Sphingomicrobium sp.]